MSPPRPVSTALAPEKANERAETAEVPASGRPAAGPGLPLRAQSLLVTAGGDILPWAEEGAALRLPALHHGWWWRPGGGAEPGGCPAARPWRGGGLDTAFLRSRDPTEFDPGAVWGATGTGGCCAAGPSTVPP